MPSAARVCVVPNAHRATRSRFHLTPDPLAGIRDGILRGVAHALSNRVAALSGVAGLVEFGDMTSQRIAKALGSEVGQLHALVELVRLLPVDPRARAEAIELQAMLPQIVALHAMHGELRDVSCSVQHDRAALPVHVLRPVLVYGMLILIDTAKRDALPSQGSVTVGYRGDPEGVSIGVESRHGDGAASTATDAATHRDRIGTMFRQLDPTLDPGVDQVAGEWKGLRLALRLPTLAEVRRRERRDA